MLEKRIIVLGANPAWQKTLFFDTFTPGKVNRAYDEKNYSSGKGVNFCRALRCSGAAQEHLFQFAGGINGKRLCDGLNADGFFYTTIETEAETRCCITCLDKNGNMTEFIGKSSPVLPQESAAMLQALKNALPEAGVMAITGSLPDGSDPMLVADAAKSAIAADVPVLIDALIMIREILALPGKIILKVNKEEFLRIFNCNDLIAAHKLAAEKFPDKIFAITDGGDNATLSDGKNLFIYTMPKINVISPLGAGDTASAVMAALYAEGQTPQEAFKQALAAASANCENAVAGQYLPARALEIVNKITVTCIPLEKKA